MQSKKGEGSVYFRKDRKKWMAQYYDYDAVSQKRIHKIKSCKTEEEARAYLQAIMFQKENPIYIANNGIPLKELMLVILNNKFETNSISESQYQRVKMTLKSLFKGNIVNKKIDEITADEIQKFLNTYKDLSDSSIKKVHAQFNQAFKYAVDRGYIVRNPMSQVIRPKSNRGNKVIRAMTIDEQRRFVDYLQAQTLEECRMRNEFLIQLFMGLRVGEYLALSENDIDLASGKIYVHKTLSRDMRGAVIMSTSPKTQAGNRYLPIPNSLYPYIIEQMRWSQMQKNNTEKMLFKPIQGKYMQPETVNRELDRILTKLKIEHMASHSLRHTYATRAIEAGIAPVVLQKLMGHTDISTTLNTYTSVFDKYKETELEKINKYYMNQNLLQGRNLKDVALEKDMYLVNENFKDNQEYIN